MALVLVLVLVVDKSLDLTSLEVEVELDVVVSCEQLECLLTHRTRTIHHNQGVVLELKAREVNFGRLVRGHVGYSELRGVGRGSLNLPVVVFFVSCLCEHGYVNYALSRTIIIIVTKVNVFQLVRS